MAATRPTLPLLQAASTAANAAEERTRSGGEKEGQSEARTSRLLLHDHAASSSAETHHDLALHQNSESGVGPLEAANLESTSSSLPGASAAASSGIRVEHQEPPPGGDDVRTVKQEQPHPPGGGVGDAKPKAKRHLPNAKKPPPPPQVVEEYRAALYFRGVLCAEADTDPYDARASRAHDLFHYTDRAYRDHAIRFDPAEYPLEGGLDGPGAARLVRDLKNSSLEPLNLSRGSPALRGAQRRLFCLRGDVRKSSHIVQTCRCNVNLILRTDERSHYMRCGKGWAVHAGHARIVHLAKHRVLPPGLVPPVAASTGEPMEGFFPDQVVVIRPDHVPPANVTVGSEEVVEYSARMAFEAAPCLLDDTYDASNLALLELYSYTHPRLKHMVVRFDPTKYPLEGGFDGPGWKALMSDLKDRSEDPLCLHSVAAQDKDRLRRLCCRRGQMHHAKFVVQECHCPVRLLVHLDRQSFYLRCGDGCAVHQGHPPLPKVYSQRGIPKRRYNPDGTVAVKAEPGTAGAALPSSAAAAAARGASADDEAVLALPPSKAGKRLWPYVTQLVEAADGLPWQHVEAAGRQVQEIAEEVELRKQAREGQRAAAAGGGSAKRARAGGSGSGRQQRQQQASAEDDANSASAEQLAAHHHQPQPQAQLPQHPQGQSYYHQQTTTAYHPHAPPQNFYL